MVFSMPRSTRIRKNFCAPQNKKAALLPFGSDAAFFFGIEPYFWEQNDSERMRMLMRIM